MANFRFRRDQIHPSPEERTFFAQARMSLVVDPAASGRAHTRSIASRRQGAGWGQCWGLLRPALRRCPRCLRAMSGLMSVFGIPPIPGTPPCRPPSSAFPSGSTWRSFLNETIRKRFDLNLLFLKNQPLLRLFPPTRLSRFPDSWSAPHRT